MGAKQKSNTANAVGDLVIAGLVGGLVHSWLVFGIAADALVAAAVHSHESLDGDG